MDSGRVDINNVLSQMRVMRDQAQAKPIAPSQDVAGQNNLQLRGIDQGVQKTDFQNVLTSAIDQVNELQKTSGALATQYELGDTTVSLSDVMVASQKSSIAFQAMTQVRNRLVEAYQEVMNMPI